MHGGGGRGVLDIEVEKRQPYAVSKWAAARTVISASQ